MHRVLLLVGCTCFAAQAQVTIVSVTDAASFAPRVAPGALATIFGANLASSQAQASATPLPTTLNGTYVSIAGAQVPLVYVSPTQINFQVPSGLSTGTTSLLVHSNSGTSAAFSFTVTNPAPSLFQYGSNHAVAQNSDAAATLNSAAAPAATGSVITVYLTGQGPVDHPVSDGAAAPMSQIAAITSTASATIGAQNASIQFLGLAPGFVGLAQANIQVPNLPTGDYPLVITIAGITSPSAIVSVSGSSPGYVSPLVHTGTAAFLNSSVSSVALLSNVAYVCGSSRITIVDVSNPANPSVIGEFGDANLAGAGTVCAINTNVTSPYLVDIIRQQASPVSLAVFDLSSPTSPRLLTVTQTAYPYLVSFSFNLTYGCGTTSYYTYSNLTITAQQGDFVCFDFTNPSSPKLISVLQPAIAGLKPYSAIVNPYYAYIAGSTATGSNTNGSGAIYIVSIASPYSLAAINQMITGPADIFMSFAVSGNTLLVLGNTSGNRNPGVVYGNFIDFGFTGYLTVNTFDITNSAAPLAQAGLTTNLQVNGTLSAAAFTNGVFAIVNNSPISDLFGPPSLMVIDARSPANPKIYPYQTEFGLSGILATTGGYLLAPTVHGLNIYQLNLQ